MVTYLPDCQVWVDGSEVEAYRENNPGANVIECAPGVQGNYCRVRNHILDQETGKGFDVIVLLDDDVRFLAYYERGKHKKLYGKDFKGWLEKYTVMALDLGARMWGVNVNIDRQSYREYAPFSMVSYIGGPFSVHINSPLRYEEDLILKEDYDLTLQHLNKYRKVLKVNKYHYICKQGLSGTGQVGGAAGMRNFEIEKAQFRKLQVKWGSDIVQTDTGVQAHNRKRKKSIGDWNPRLKVPIKGI